MSLSVTGYSHQGYPHPGPTGHDLYQYPQMPRYSDHCADATYFQNWVLNGHHPDVQMSPESYGMCTPSPTDFHVMGHYVSDTIRYTSDGVPIERCIKRRTSANKKERRRTLSINSAFATLRGCIPNVPSDTKLSKIKTLRLATSYISYLMDVLEKDDPQLTEDGFKAELVKKTDKKSTPEEKKHKEHTNSDSSESTSPSSIDKKSKGRTGWPQHVWASELKQ
ncbi:heart- and neural crest derivatives-expressed protein 2-like [Ylistrum balloti]|uniref:heart- and neural crest derivatives-expressed protein 2-like n=1 Tax=Ylistrum balloti TaxID=509963 RepID=UPI0029058622|nr:heart- and neural crest derivatives-expressed protein 2-like [Ylistrum balloti]